MFDRDRQNVLDIKEAVDKILSYTKNINDCIEFEKNILVFDAVLMNVVVIGEAVGRLSDPFKDEHDNIEWAKIKGLRNIIAHDYFGIDIEEIWQIIDGTIPEFLVQIDVVLKDL